MDKYILKTLSKCKEQQLNLRKEVLDKLAKVSKKYGGLDNAVAENQEQPAP